ncbi:MAG: hypothetical protein B7Z73_09220 [Planctomycetia bacterium 21-64-5]|nr:MAG: hypothetical protein B7Z73_09220 [Planctomycetia bacterium 21-64-5]
MGLCELWVFDAWIVRPMQVHSYPPSAHSPPGGYPLFLLTAIEVAADNAGMKDRHDHRWGPAIAAL